MLNFIIATHSEMAEGLYKSLKFFKDDIENFQFINAYVEHNNFEDDLRKSLSNIKEGKIIILTDMMGGSVNQICSKLILELDVILIAGINLPLLLELAFLTEFRDSNQIRDLVNKARNQIVLINDILVENQNEDL